MRNQSFVRSVSVVLSVLLLSATFAQAAEAPKYETARHEAFMRGGAAITEALNYKEDTKPPANPAINDAVPPSGGVPSTPQATKENTHMAAWKYAALGASFAVMGILLYHWATGPGASIRNCSTCSK